MYLSLLPIPWVVFTKLLPVDLESTNFNLKSILIVQSVKCGVDRGLSFNLVKNITE